MLGLPLGYYLFPERRRYAPFELPTFLRKLLDCIFKLGLLVQWFIFIFWLLFLIVAILFACSYMCFVITYFLDVKQINDQLICLINR